MRPKRSMSGRGFLAALIVTALFASLAAIAVPTSPAGARPHAPTFAAIKEYRQREGLDLDLTGHPGEIAARIRGLIAAWRAGDHLARSTASTWGVPLRKADLKLMEFRQTVLRRWGDQFEPWLARHPQADATYAGYFANPESGGWIYVGFTAEQAALVAKMKHDLHLVGPGLIRPFPYQPAHTEAELGALQESISEDDSLWKLMSSMGIETELNEVRIASTHVAKLRAILAERYGADAPIQVEFGLPPELL
jgi:hypothetical protein